MYVLRWKNPNLEDTNKRKEIQVPIGSVVSNAASIRFTGKGAANYGQIQQENLMRLLEHFADNVEPLYPTAGQMWFDTSIGVMKVCSKINAGTATWRSLGGVQALGGDDSPPSPASIGDLWSQGPRSSTSESPYPAATGTLYTYTGLGRHPQVGSTIGGWSQVWPPVETIAGREEYNAVRDLVLQLIGPAGNNLLGTVIPPLPDLDGLDQNLRSKFQTATLRDQNTLTPSTETDVNELMVDVTSQDWDALLAAARLAISRLDIPQDMIQDISPMPFVSDGRPVPTWMSKLPAESIMYPTLERRSNRRFGIVTLSRAFTETVNVINMGIANRFSLKGIGGSNGPNATFGPNTQTVVQRAFSGDAGGASNGTVTLRLRFADAKALNSFINSGGAVQLVASHSVNSAPQLQGDADFKSLVDSRGVIRVTGDKVRVFSNTQPRTLTGAAESKGMNNVTGETQLTSQTRGATSYSVSMTKVNDSQLNVRFDFSAGSPMNGTVTVSFETIRDMTTYTSPEGNVMYAFSGPQEYEEGDKIAATPFLN